MKLLALAPILSILLLLRGELMPEKAQWRVPGDFPTIQAALDAAHEGDTILIAPGTYQEHLVIAKSLTLQGAGPNTILEGEPSAFEPFREESEEKQPPGVRMRVERLAWLAPIQDTKTVGQPAIVIQAGQVQIRGLQIRPQGLQVDLPPGESPPPVPRPLRAGVVVEKGAEALLEQVVIRNAHYGVVVKRGASLTLRHSILHNWRRGFQIWGTATIEDSSIYNQDIYESESSEVAVLIEGGQAFFRRNWVSIFHVAPYGIPPHRIGDFVDRAIEASDSELVIENNHIVGDLHHGIYLSRGKAVIRANLLVYRGGNEFSTGLEIWFAEAMVEGNTIIGLMPHGVGIQINPEAQVVLKQNRLSRNGIGIEVSGASARLIENEIYANKTGIQLPPREEGDARAQVELVRNKINQNEECGVAAQSSRYVEGQKVYEIFKGQLEGEEKEIQGNLRSDLCPPDYPWPEGFRK
jgi:nitrous oxidase accessory protein NosD